MRQLSVVMFSCFVTMRRSFECKFCSTHHLHNIREIWQNIDVYMWHSQENPQAVMGMRLYFLVNVEIWCTCVVCCHDCTKMGFLDLKVGTYQWCPSVRLTNSWTGVAWWWRKTYPKVHCALPGIAPCAELLQLSGSFDTGHLFHIFGTMQCISNEL